MSTGACYLQAGEEPDQISQITIIRGVKRSYIRFSLTTVDNKGCIFGGEQYEQRKRTRDSAVAVSERMDLYEAVVISAVRRSARSVVQLVMSANGVSQPPWHPLASRAPLPPGEPGLVPDCTDTERPGR